MNKVPTVNVTIQDSEPEDKRATMDSCVSTKKLQAPGAVYNPRCLLQVLLTGVLSPHETWRILYNRDKKLHITEA